MTALGAARAALALALLALGVAAQVLPQLLRTAGAAGEGSHSCLVCNESYIPQTAGGCGSAPALPGEPPPARPPARPAAAREPELRALPAQGTTDPVAEFCKNKKAGRYEDVTAETPYCSTSYIECLEASARKSAPWRTLAPWPLAPSRAAKLRTSSLPVSIRCRRRRWDRCS